MHWSSQLHVKQKSFQSIPERVHSDARISQFSRQTVPDSRSLNGETTVAEFCSRSWKLPTIATNENKIRRPYWKHKVDRSVQVHYRFSKLKETKNETFCTIVTSATR